MQIGKERKNEIALAISESTFSPADFETDDGPLALGISHKPSGARLVVNFGSQHGISSDFMVFWSVGDEPGKTLQTDYLSYAVDSWLEDIKTDQETPDLFAEIGKPPQISSLAEEDDNRPFDPGEQAEVAAWAADLKLNANERYGIDGEQMKALEEKIDYLVEASQRMGRKDWVILAVGYIGTTVLDSGVKEQILQGLASALGHLFGHPVPLLPPH